MYATKNICTLKGQRRTPIFEGMAGINEESLALVFTIPQHFNKNSLSFNGNNPLHHGASMKSLNILSAKSKSSMNLVVTNIFVVQQVKKKK